MTPLQLGSLIPQSSLAVPCFVEQFANGLTPYAQVSGNPALFSVASGTYGQTLTAATQNSSTISAIQRSTNSIIDRTVSLKFNVLSDNTDDACAVQYSSSGTPIMTFNPRREGATDPLRRPQFQVDSEIVHIGSGGEIALNTWYQFDCYLIAGAGNSTYKITRLSDGVSVIPITTLASSHSPSLMDMMTFFIDKNGPTCPTSYADIDVCPSIQTVINLDGVINAGSTSAVGIRLDGLNPAATYIFTEPIGQTYTAVSLDGGTNWQNTFQVQQGSGASVQKGDGLNYSTAAAARAAFPGGTITGQTNYTFWINDSVPAGNLGGLSIKVTGS